MAQPAPVWHPACRTEEIPDGGAVVVPLTPPIAVFNIDGELYATDDTCTHAEYSLSEGYIEDGTVECALHFAKFCVRTGKALTPPAVIPLATYQVKVEDGTVLVDVSSRSQENTAPCQRSASLG